MLGVIAGTAMLAFLGYMIFKDGKASKKDLERFYMLSKNKVTVIPVSKNWQLVQMGLLAALCMMMVYVSQHPEQAGTTGSIGFMAICAGMMAVLILNMTFMKKYQELYINKDGFHDKGKCVRFSSIKSIDPALARYEVETYTGQKIRISSGKGKALIEVMEQRDRERQK